MNDAPDCRFPDCSIVQEFPDGEDDLCIVHSLGVWSYWRPLAAFGPIEQEWSA